MTVLGIQTQTSMTDGCVHLHIIRNDICYKEISFFFFSKVVCIYIPVLVSPHLVGLERLLEYNIQNFQSQESIR